MAASSRPVGTIRGMPTTSPPAPAEPLDAACAVDTCDVRSRAGSGSLPTCGTGPPLREPSPAVVLLPDADRVTEALGGPEDPLARARAATVVLAELEQLRLHVAQQRRAAAVATGMSSRALAERWVSASGPRVTFVRRPPAGCAGRVADEPARPSSGEPLAASGPVARLPRAEALPAVRPTNHGGRTRR